MTKIPSTLLLMTALVSTAAQSSAQELRAPASHRFSGFVLESPDESFTLQIGARMMNDWAFAVSEAAGVEESYGAMQDTTEMRRARIALSGALYRSTEFKLEYDFADGTAKHTDVYLVQTGIPLLGAVRVGHGKEPFGLEEVTTSNATVFLERSLPAAFIPSRNTGIMAERGLLSKRMTLAVGVFRESGDASESLGNGSAVTGRITAVPVASMEGATLVHLGVAYSLRNPPSDTVQYSARPEVHLASRYVDTGTLGADRVHLLGAEFLGIYRRLTAQAEYVRAMTDATPGGSDATLTSYYAYASCFLTEGTRAGMYSSGKLKTPSPSSVFDPSEGQFGAWEVALRYSAIDLDDGPVKGGRLTDITLGLNWYLNPSTRVMMNYVIADVAGVGSASFYQMRFHLFF